MTYYEQRERTPNGKSRKDRFLYLLKLPAGTYPERAEAFKFHGDIYKIGASLEPHTRLAALRSWTGCRAMQLDCAFYKLHARKEESWWHKFFASRWINLSGFPCAAEWFALTPADRDLFVLINTVEQIMSH